MVGSQQKVHLPQLPKVPGGERQAVQVLNELPVRVVDNVAVLLVGNPVHALRTSFQDDLANGHLTFPADHHVHLRMR